MITKLVIPIMGFIVPLSIFGYQFTPALVDVAVAQETIDQKIVQFPTAPIDLTQHFLLPPTENPEPEVELVNQVEVTPNPFDMPEELATHPDINVLLQEMTFVWLLAEEYARIETVCAGNGLVNIAPAPDGSKIVIPNAGDLSVDGSNVAIKLNPDGDITFIPRVQGQRIRVPMDVGDKLAGWEVDSLSLSEAMQLMAADKMVWTAKWFGPYGNGHGLPGHIAECDPLYPGS